MVLVGCIRPQHRHAIVAGAGVDSAIGRAVVQENNVLDAQREVVLDERFHPGQTISDETDDNELVFRVRDLLGAMQMFYIEDTDLRRHVVFSHLQSPLTSKGAPSRLSSAL